MPAATWAGLPILRSPPPAWRRISRTRWCGDILGVDIGANLCSPFYDHGGTLWMRALTQDSAPGRPPPGDGAGPRPASRLRGSGRA